MKKRFYFYSLIAAMLLSACSKDSNNGFAAAEEEEDGMSNVPITLGSGGYFNFTSLSTKASINPDQNWVGNTNIGIFGLAEGATDWTDTDTSNGHLPDCLMSNVKGTVAQHSISNAVVDTIISYTPLQYYPMSSAKHYSFYGYHPHQATNSGTTITDTNISTTYTINGTQDILWGKAVATPISGVDGYNAKYFRQDGAAVPLVKFNHLLTRLVFQIVAGNDKNFDPDYGDIPATDLTVEYIKVLNAGSNPTLTIANANNEGTLTWSTTTAEFDLCDASGSKVTAQTVTNEATKMGESIMLRPGVASYEIEVGVKVTNPQGSQPTETFVSKLTLNAPASSDNLFKAGNSHTVTLTVNGLKAVLVAAKVSEWIEGESLGLEVN